MNNAQSKYSVTCLKSLDDWLPLKDAWKALLKTTEADNPFLTFEWISAWTECFLKENRKLLILLVKKEETIVGIAPWYVEQTTMWGLPLREIRFIGNPEGGSDYLDVFTQKGIEREVAHALYRYLSADTSHAWDQLRLQCIPANSLFLLHFIERIKTDGKFFETAAGAFCPRIQLPGTFEDFLLQVSPKRRHKFRRHLRTLEKTGTVQHQVFLGESLQEGLNKFFALFEAKKKYDWKGLSKLFQQLLSRGQPGNLEVDLLSVDQRPVAGLLHIRYHDNMYQYSMVSDKQFNPKISVGNILVGLSIQRTIEQGMQYYDFLKGAEPYKFHWAFEGRSALNLTFYRKTPVSLLLLTGRQFRKVFKLLVR